MTTIWSLVALRSTGNDGDKHEGTKERPQVKVEARTTSIEHLVLRYLLALGDGGNKHAEELQKQILAHQNHDGGWGWLLEGPSDALATGQALYALSYMASEDRCDAVRRAHQFLVRTQQPDGSWRVPSTLQEGDQQPYVVSNDWGTAWAVIGLLRTAGG